MEQNASDQNGTDGTERGAPCRNSACGLRGGDRRQLSVVARGGDRARAVGAEGLCELAVEVAGVGGESGVVFNPPGE